MQTDPIADFLTSIRNAAAAKHQRVDVPASRLKSEIARILKEEGYISTFKMVDENKGHKTLRVFLKYTPDRRSVISGIKRISRPGARRYVGSQDVKPVVGAYLGLLMGSLRRAGVQVRDGVLGHGPGHARPAWSPGNWPT